MRTIRQWRVTSFGKPVAPWRSDRDQVIRDLLELGLGSYDEWGTLYVTVPADIQRREVPISCIPQSVTSALPAR